MPATGTARLLRLGSVVAVLSLLTSATTVLPWGKYNARVSNGEIDGPVALTGLEAPVGGTVVAGLGGLAALAAAVVVFTQGRGWRMPPARWMAYAAGFLALAVYFLLRAQDVQAFEGTVRGSGEPIHFTKTSGAWGFVAALVLASAAALVSLGAALWAWRRSGAPPE